MHWKIFWRPQRGDAHAQCNLGLCYENGEGVGENPTEAVKGYRLAADQGDAGAQCYLGCCYENGRGVKKDYSKALDLYQQALNNGCEDAKERIRVLNLLHGR